MTRAECVQPVRRVLEHPPVPLHAAAEALGCEGYLHLNRELAAGEVAALLAVMERRAGGACSPAGVVDARATLRALQQSCKVASEGAQQREPIPGRLAAVRAKLSAANALAAMDPASAAAALQEAASALEEVRALQAAPARTEAAPRATHKISRFAAGPAAPAQQPLPGTQQPEQEENGGAGRAPPHDAGGVAPPSLRTWFPPLSPATPAAQAAKPASQAPSLGGSGLGGAGAAPPSAAAGVEPPRQRELWLPPPAQRLAPAGAARTSLARLLDDVLEEVLSPGPSKGQKKRRRRLVAKRRAAKRQRLTPAPGPSHALQTLRQGEDSPAAPPDAPTGAAVQPAEVSHMEEDAPPAAAGGQAMAGAACPDAGLTPLANGSAKQGGGSSSKNHAEDEPEQASGPPAADQGVPNGVCSPDGGSSEEGALVEEQASPATPGKPMPPALAVIFNGQVRRLPVLHRETRLQSMHLSRKARAALSCDWHHAQLHTSCASGWMVKSAPPFKVHLRSQCAALHDTRWRVPPVCQAQQVSDAFPAPMGFQ